MKKKSDFWEKAFGDESRNPFPEKTDKTLHEAFKELCPEITDDELIIFIKHPENLSTAKLEYILSNIQHDPEILRHFEEISKNYNKDLLKE